MIGTILNHRYRITELIGTGGMAHVYRAVNMTTRKPVAIKVLKEEYRNDPEFLRRFEREARAVLHLSHENIVRAYGVGQYEELPFIVLEYVEGQTLKQLIQEQGSLPVQQSVHIACQILSALSAAHNAGIIHRDVKPQNVIVTPSGSIKLTDFGIAREERAETVTFAGSKVLGSVHYVSPEQAKGKPVTAASDIYSVGVTLYEMLTGHVPFDGESSVTIALMHLREAPEPPLSLLPDLPPSLNDVVLKALEKDAGMRYASADAMRSDLFRTLRDPNGDFAKPGQKNQQDRGLQIVLAAKSRRNLILIGSLVFLLLFMLLGMFVLARNYIKTEPLNTQVIPVLTNRTVADASLKAQNYAFSFEISDYAYSESVPYGSVISQTPEAGVNAKEGTVIHGIVSLGADAPLVPQLIGLTPDAAVAAIEEAGFVFGVTSYRISDVEIGYVCQQTPTAGQEAVPGQIIDICISATSSEGIVMPSVMGLPFSEALALLEPNAFSRILVHFVDATNAPNDTVIAQMPSDGATATTATKILLTVSRDSLPPYTADIAFNIDIAASGSEVVVISVESCNEITYEHVLFEATLEKGEKIPVSFTALSDTAGMSELVLYINDVESRRQDANFIEKQP